jgi:hypothetical protein
VTAAAGRRLLRRRRRRLRRKQRAVRRWRRRRGGGSNYTGAATNVLVTDGFQPGNGWVGIVYRVAATSTVVASSGNPSTAGQPVTFTATVTPASGAGTPTGTVTFSDSGTQLGTATLGASGTATFTTTSPLPAGAHTITASYGGDSGFAGSTGSLTQTVQYKVQLLYDSAKAHHSGATVQVTLQLLNAAGTNLSASGVPVTVTGLSPSPASGTAPTGTFTFLNKGPGYQLNINTTGYPAGTYTLSFTAGSDPTVHTAQFVIS